MHQFCDQQHDKLLILSNQLNLSDATTKGTEQKWSHWADGLIRQLNGQHFVKGGASGWGREALINRVLTGQV